jgi:FkbM family methyltransferase
MIGRDSRHRIAQGLLWNPVGWWVLRLGNAIVRRYDAIAMNYSLHSPTNGEYWLIDQLPRDEPVTAFDVGFHQGNFTAQVLQRRPSNASIIAFDPWRPAQAAFTSRFGGDPRVRLVASALAATPGKATFHDYGSECNSLAPRDDGGTERATYDVPVETLDQWCDTNHIRRITFLKIDAEGFDVAVLEGASALLAESRIDLIMFEYSTAWIAARRFLRDAALYMQRFPYRLHRLWNGFLTPFEYNVRDEAFALRNGMFVATADASQWAASIPRRSCP